MPTLKPFRSRSPHFLNASRPFSGHGRRFGGRLWFTNGNRQWRRLRKSPRLPIHNFLKGIANILDKVKAVGYLNGRGYCSPKRVGVGGRPVSCGNNNARAVLQPLEHILLWPPFYDVDRFATLQVADNRTVGASLPQCEVVQADDTRRWNISLPLIHNTEKSPPTDLKAHDPAELSADSTAHGHNQVPHDLGHSPRSLCMALYKARKRFDEGLLWALSVQTTPTAGHDSQPHIPALHWQIPWIADVPAVFVITHVATTGTCLLLRLPFNGDQQVALHRLNRKDATSRQFHWQHGYASFSIAMLP
jgi:hypothetical protein